MGMGSRVFAVNSISQEEKFQYLQTLLLVTILELKQRHVWPSFWLNVGKQLTGYTHLTSLAMTSSVVDTEPDFSKNDCFMVATATCYEHISWPRTQAQQIQNLLLCLQHISQEMWCLEILWQKQ